MDNPGPFQLTLGGSAFSIAGPGVYTGDVIEGFEGITAATFQAAFMAGAGGTSVALFIQTSIDQGQTWADIVSMLFTSANAVEAVNLCGLTPKTTPAALTQQGLASGTCNDGLLGDRFRAVVAVSGTYTASTLLTVSGMAR